ncbi:RING-H2 finger protein ATL72-like [Selaginella moellendorffii]|uniref:RING-H2 finger protein ATL72-like n=1 Tax=Selaginella moellendorffii TaxID=88036 RepID=UPI000D1C6303|nr:RING-H2 finger protein ATL72-like [Selaginella moellendorffii]|eukprot:XP_024522966.1 RING-H2 finger protein ATL72-like [Selaginella moellendorffii]
MRRNGRNVLVENLFLVGFLAGISRKIEMLGAPPPNAAASAASAVAPTLSGYDIGQNFTSALAIGAAAIVCTLALLAFYFCRYVSLDRGGGGGDSSAASGSSQWSGGGGGGGGAAAAGHLEKIPVVGAGEVAGRIKGGEFCAVCLTDFQQQQSRLDPASDRLRFLPHCSHCFHCDCVDEWLQKHLFCPVCRTSLVAAAATAAGSKSQSTATDTAAAAAAPTPPEQSEQSELQIVIVVDPGARTDRDREVDREETKQ